MNFLHSYNFVSIERFCASIPDESPEGAAEPVPKRFPTTGVVLEAASRLLRVGKGAT